VALVFASVLLGVFVVLWFGRLGGPAVTTGALWAAFGVLFAIACVFRWRATVRGRRARVELEKHLDVLAGRIAMAARRPGFSSSI
jgi:hypothetical protein